MLQGLFLQSQQVVGADPLSTVLIRSQAVCRGSLRAGDAAGRLNSMLGAIVVYVV